MNIQKLIDCAEVLGELSNNFTNLPTDDTKALEAGQHCLMARTYVLELAAHLTKGMEPYDAYVATAKGELEIPESKTLVLKVLTARPPDRQSDVVSPQLDPPRNRVEKPVLPWPAGAPDWEMHGSFIDDVRTSLTGVARAIAPQLNPPKRGRVRLRIPARVSHPWQADAHHCLYR